MAGPGIITITRSDAFSTRVFHEFMGMKKERLWVDFEIKSEKHSLPCHKMIVSASSPFLKALLTSDMIEAAKQEVRMDHIDIGILKFILDYMYSGQASIHCDQLMDTIKASDYLQMMELKEQCAEHVPDILEPSNVINWLTMSKKSSLLEVEEKCLDLMVSRVEEVSKQPDFQELSYADLHDYFEKVITKYTGGDRILRAALTWVSHKTDTRIECFENLLQQVKLDTCTMEGIGEVINIHDDLLQTYPLAYKMLTQGMNRIASVRRVELEPLVQDYDMQEVLVVADGYLGKCLYLNERSTYKELTQMPADVKDGYGYASVCPVPLGFAVTGGNSDSCSMFIASTMTWSKLPSLLSKRQCHASICAKGQLHVFGGRGNTKDLVDEGILSSVDYLQIHGGQWSHGPEMPNALTSPKVAGIDYSVYLLDDQKNQLFHLDVNEKTWSERAPFPAKEGYEAARAAIVAVREKILLAGGSFLVCSWYTPSTDTWCLGRRILSKDIQIDGALVQRDNKVLLLGGDDWSPTGDKEYDLETGSWRTCSFQLPYALFGHCAMMLSIPKLK